MSKLWQRIKRWFEYKGDHGDYTDHEWEDHDWFEKCSVCGAQESKLEPDWR